MFTCKGCTEVARLVGEVEDLRKMMESLKRMVTGQGLEEKRGETGDQEATLEEAEEKEQEKCVGEKTRDNSSTDNMDGKRIHPGAQMLATHDYKKNPDSPVGNELDVNEGDTLVYLMTNENNEQWWLTEDGKGQVGYVPAAYLKIITDVTRQEEEHIDWNDKMKNKTATEWWNILRRELDSATDSFVPMKKLRKRSKKKHLSKEAFRKIRHKQNMWRVYKHTGKDQDCVVYK